MSRSRGFEVGDMVTWEDLIVLDNGESMKVKEVGTITYVLSTQYVVLPRDARVEKFVFFTDRTLKPYTDDAQ